MTPIINYLLSYGVLCNQVDNNNLPRSWILLDNESTIDVLYNKDLLKNFFESGESMIIHCNAGTTSTILYGTTKNGTANILSFSRVKEETFGITQTNQFIVHKDDGSKQVFEQSIGCHFL